MAEVESATPPPTGKTTPTPPPTGKTVVIGMDGSDNSKYALQWYVHNAWKDGDKIVMVYCVELSEVFSASQIYHAPNPVEADAFQTILTHELHKVQAKLEEFATYMKELKVDGVVKSTHAHKPGEGIINVAKDVGAKLIVTGTRGLGRIRRTLLGSVSNYLIHHSHVPVLVCQVKEAKETETKETETKETKTKETETKETETKETKETETKDNDTKKTETKDTHDS